MKRPAKQRNQAMKTNRKITDHNHRDKRQYALRRGLGFWEVTYEGPRAIFKHELGALYVACLLLDPPPEPIHAVALALKARDMSRQSPGPAKSFSSEAWGLMMPRQSGPYGAGNASWSGCWRTARRSSR